MSQGVRLHSENRPSKTGANYREADVHMAGNRLGPIGGRIVTEVLIGLIDADATSFRRKHRDWQSRKALSELLAA